MKAAERRREIANLFLSSDEAISGGELSERFGISRHIVPEL